MLPRHAPRSSLASALCAVALLAPLACSSGDDASTTDAAAGATDDDAAVVATTTASAASDDLPEDPCAITTAAIEQIGWTVAKTEIVDGPGGPHSQCTFDATGPEETFENGWVMFIPGSQLKLEYHEDEKIDGLGVEAYRGSPQSGEILVTGADPAFRIWSHESDAAVALAKAVIAAS